MLRDNGKKLRTDVPRESHAEWAPPKKRPDPVDIVLRGAAWDLAHTPSTGHPVVMDGDAHLNNFGFYGTPQRDLVFDLNDFDEVTIGPWEWDLKRLAASVNVAARDNGAAIKSGRVKTVAGFHE